MALGGDQGGSIRIPAAACGIVGLKPTYGLVPYTGIMSIEFTLDHTGPMARTVHDTALMLEVRLLEDIVMIINMFQLRLSKYWRIIVLKYHRQLH